MREAGNLQIFERARRPGVVFTKDEDLVGLVPRLGTAPQVLWLMCGDRSDARLKTVLGQTLGDAIELLRQGEAVV